MKRRYRVQFDITASPDCDVTAVAQMALHWASSKFDDKAKVVGLSTSAGGGYSEHRAKIETMCDPGETRAASWAMRLVQPSPSEVWTTEIVVAQRDQHVQFCLTNGVAVVGNVLTPPKWQPTRPRLVPDVLTQWRGVRGCPISSEAATFGPGDIAGLTDLLLSPSRELPIVFVSAKEWDDKPIADAQRIAGQLAGLAHVAVASNRWTSNSLRKVLPDLGCWDGYVRIYWPRLSPHDQPYRHPYFTPEEIEDQEWRQGGFAGFLLGRLANLSAYGEEHQTLSWRAVEEKSRRRALEELKAAGDSKLTDYCQTAEAMIRDLEGRVAELEGALDEVARDRDQARHKAFALGQQLAEVRRGGDLAAVRIPIESVGHAIEQATAQFSSTLVFALNSTSEIRRNTFERPEELFTALAFLAQEYAAAKLSGGMPDPDSALRKLLPAWFYAGKQAASTVGMNPTDYTAHHDGKRYELGKHIGTGSSKEPRYTIRVAFDWDHDLERIIVGFVGQHQTTRAS